MRKSTKIWLAVAAALIVLGGAMFAGAVSSNGWDIRTLSTESYRTETIPVEGAFADISVRADIADIVLLPSDDGSCKAVFYEQEDAQYTASVQGGTLTVTGTEPKKRLSFFAFYGTSPKITLYLPEAEYASLLIRGKTGDAAVAKELRFDSAEIVLTTGSVKMNASVSGALRISTTTGDILAESIAAGSVGLETTTGDVTARSVAAEGAVTVGVRTGEAYLYGVSCRELTSDGSTGDILLSGVTASERIAVTRTTGDVRLDSSDAPSLFLKASTGDVTGTLLTGKTFSAHATTGDVSVPQSAGEGTCEIKTTTGDIRIRIK